MLPIKNQDLLRSSYYANGEWKVTPSGKTFEVRNPADNSFLMAVADAGRAETCEAIEAAERAFPAWRAKTAGERAGVLKKWHDLILENVEDLAVLMTLEQGKPLAESRGEVRYGATFIEWFAEEGKRVYGDIIPPHMANLRLFVQKQPVGVVGAITPWNFPNAMITRKVAPALAAGCTVVIKPSEETPLSALALAFLAEKAGFPAGVLNVVTGMDASAIGKELCENPSVKKISFTGSTRVGKVLMKQAADTVKKISLELGGNAPFIVFDDADLDAAAAGAVISKYRNAGQTCVCANRIFVQRSVAEKFTTKLIEASKKLKIGSGLEDGVSIGPLINKRAVEKVEKLIADALQKGAEVKIGGKKEHGQFYPPTILTGVEKGMAILEEEIFGPVAPIIVFDTDEEAIKMANDTPYGLAAYFYGRDLSRVWRAAEGLDYGMIGVNTGLVATTVAPFGGMKESGIGREGSKYGLEEFLEIKYVCMAV